MKSKVESRSAPTAFEIPRRMRSPSLQIACPDFSASARDASAPRTRVEKLSRSCHRARGSWHAFDAIPKTPEFADHLRGTRLRALLRDCRSPFLVRDPIVKDLPDKPTEPVCNRPDRLGMS